MSFLSSIFRCLCLCLVIQRGSWYPNPQNISSQNQRKPIKDKIQTCAPKKRQATLRKPEWLKEWTISKGWVHNKSHLLELGRKKLTDMDKKNYEELSENSSVSMDNIEDLISIKSIENDEDNRKMIDIEDDSSIPEEEDDDENIKISSVQRVSQVYQEVNKNYRDHFPICSHGLKESQENSLPQIYKERLLMDKKDYNLLSGIFRYVKPAQKKKLDLNNCKFTVNRLYEDRIFSGDSTERKLESQKFGKRNNLGKNIALFNTLNAKTNLHEDIIYECSDENSNYNSLNNIYFNPIYSPLPLQKFDNFNSNQTNQIELLDRRAIAIHNYQENLKLLTKREKYVIRHIKIRFMLSLRIGRFKKTNKKPGIKKQSCFRSRKSEKLVDKSDYIKMRVAKIHDEQRRIGNGRTSVKIQNMR